MVAYLRSTDILTDRPVGRWTVRSMAPASISGGVSSVICIMVTALPGDLQRIIYYKLIILGVYTCIVYGHWLHGKCMKAFGKSVLCILQRLLFMHMTVSYFVNVVLAYAICALVCNLVVIVEAHFLYFS